MTKCPSRLWITLPIALSLLTTVPGQSRVRAQEVEPNDTFDDGTMVLDEQFGEVLLNDLLLGNGPAGNLDVDMYRIETRAYSSQFMRLEVEVQAHESQTDLLLVLGEQYQYEGELLRNDDRAYDDKNPRLITMLVGSSHYYVVVASAENPYFDPHSQASGRAGAGGAYDIRFNLEVVPDPVDPYEPNDTTGHATWMQYGSFAVSAVIWDWGPLDVDVYRLTLLEPSRLDVHALATDDMFDPVVRVRNCEDPLPHSGWTDRCLLGCADDQPDGATDAKLSVAAFEPGDVYIMISGAGNRAYDPAEPDSGEPGTVGHYDLSVTVTPLSEPTPDEPNDSIPTATPTPLLIDGRPDSFSIDGFVGDGLYATLRGDRDFYEIRTVDDSLVISVEVEAASLNSELMPVVVAYDEVGHIVGYADGSTAAAANLTLPVGCATALGEPPCGLFLMVFGAQQRLPADPFDPFQLEGSSGNVRDHRVTDGPGSTGAYRMTVSRIASPLNHSPEHTDDAGSHVSSVAAPEADFQRLRGDDALIWLHATKLGSDPAIVGLDPSFQFATTLPLPEPRVGGLGGLADWGDTIFYLGQGRFPRMYQIDKESGQIVDQYFMWIGSGYYTDATMLGDKLYLLDHRRREIHVMDPVEKRYLRSVPVGAINDITIGGGVAAIAQPARLYIADAFNTRSIYEIHPDSGAVTAIIPPAQNRPTALGGISSRLYVADFRTQNLEMRARNGTLASVDPLEAPVGLLGGFSPGSEFHDFERDQDVDLADFQKFQNCFGSSANGPCFHADAWDDGVVNLMDMVRFEWVLSGP